EVDKLGWDHEMLAFFEREIAHWEQRIAQQEACIERWDGRSGAGLANELLDSMRSTLRQYRKYHRKLGTGIDQSSARPIVRKSKPPLGDPLALSNYPSAIVHIGCEACGKNRAYHLYRLIKEYDPTTHVGNVLADLAGDCPGRTDHYESCGLS